jgi:hypothetical protein
MKMRSRRVKPTNIVWITLAPAMSFVTSAKRVNEGNQISEIYETREEDLIQRHANNRVVEFRQSTLCARVFDAW